MGGTRRTITSRCFWIVPADSMPTWEWERLSLARRSRRRRSITASSPGMGRRCGYLWMGPAPARRRRRGTTIAASGTFLRLAANSGSSAGQFFSGQLDECCVYATALSSTRISAHYTAGHSGATGTVANSLSVAANSQVSFGSPNWSAVNTWQVRFRWLSGMTTATWYLHFTNANNYLGVALTGALLRLNENVAGTVTHIASAGVTPVHEAWYWLQVTQFPTVAGMPAWVSATLSADNAGAIGGQIATVSGATVDSVTALSGQP